MAERHFCQELEKTRGSARGFTMALRDFVDNSGFVTDKDDFKVVAILTLADVLADRLDDLCNMSDELGISHVADARIFERISGVLEGDDESIVRLREQGQALRRAHLEEAFKACEGRASRTAGDKPK